MHQISTSRRTLSRLAGALAMGLGLGLAQVPAQAQDWPSKPIRMLVGFPAGGTADVIARVLAEGLRQELGQTVVVDNKPGIAGGIAAGELVNTSADGHTLLVAVSGVVSEVPHFAKVRFDPFNDIKPLAELASAGLMLVGNASSPAKNLPDLIKELKAKQGKSSYASYSAGTISHTLGLQLNKAAGLDMLHVPYRGSPPALTDAMGGQVDVMFDGTATSIPLIKGGKLRAYAVTSPTRLAAMPEVPTMTELGFPQLSDVIWMGLWLSPKVPAPVQAKLRAATLKVLAQPAVKTKFIDLGLNPGTSITPEELTAGLHKASDKHGAILRAIGMKPQDQ
jgi:tripartite-type tricarboxylate transporter receptor subunit TctC